VPRSTRLSIAVAALLLSSPGGGAPHTPGALAPGGAVPVPVPWPRGAPPSAGTLDDLLADARRLEDREQAEEWLVASESGEESDHVSILQADIDKGVYTKPQLFTLGDELFGHAFTRRDGYGDGPFNGFLRVHRGPRGGLDTFSCSGCHGVGGPDGAGAETAIAMIDGDGERETSANLRNPPALLGLGVVQALSVEISHHLQFLRLKALGDAAASKRPVQAPLEALGTTFGSLIAYPNGDVDTSGVSGVDPDLVIKPFGWKGTLARLRRFAEDAARLHFGIQSHILALHYKDQPDPDRLGPGPKWWDPDNDGHTRELEEGALTTFAVYLAMLEAPVIIPPSDPALLGRWANGRALFAKVGCEGCHRSELPLNNTSWHETSDTTKGEIVVNLFHDGDAPRGSNGVNLFSDLKRHAMGPELADPHDNGQHLGRDVFLTRPLWGLAETAPYLHDGRAATIPEAILAHGGEARAARDAFAALSAPEQADVHVFLLSLTREPKLRVGR
jgi:Di-haem oxidoreductase, putative peroxidase